VETLGTQVSASLSGVSVQIADLPSGILGEDIGKTILIDRDAAGYGWFVDPTPADDAKFAELAGADQLIARTGAAAENRADLLTAVMHEMGHAIGYDHTDDGLMSPELPLGVRRTAAVDQVFAALHGA
jgi:hypothetical protein